MLGSWINSSLKSQKSVYITISVLRDIKRSCIATEMFLGRTEKQPPKHLFFGSLNTRVHLCLGVGRNFKPAEYLLISTIGLKLRGNRLVVLWKKSRTLKQVRAVR